MEKIGKVTLIGLGAMGVFFAPRLSEELGSGFRVMADGDRKTRLEQKGVTVNSVNYRFPIITPQADDGPSDLIIISVKGYDLPRAIKDIEKQVGPDTVILSVLNGIESEAQVGAAYGMEHVLYSYMRVSVDMRDGKTEFDPDNGSIHFGEARNVAGNLSGKVLAVKDLFDRCHINYKIDEDMVHGIWYKYMCNVAENMTCAMFGVPFGAFPGNENAEYFRQKAMREVMRLANAMGIDLSEDDINHQNHVIGRVPHDNRPSTLQDLEAGKHTEVDIFAGTVVRLGREYGVETPLCEAFLHGIRLLEDKNAGRI